MIIDLNQILSTFNIDYEIAKGNNKLGGASLLNSLIKEEKFKVIFSHANSH